MCSLYTGGLTILHNNFDIENLILQGNSAYYGGAVFVSADLSVNATFSNLTFSNNVAAEGMHRVQYPMPCDIRKVGDTCLTIYGLIF